MGCAPSTQSGISVSFFSNVYKFILNLREKNNQNHQEWVKCLICLQFARISYR